MENIIKKEVESLDELLGAQEDEYLEARIINTYKLAKKHKTNIKLKKEYAPFLIKRLSLWAEQEYEIPKIEYAQDVTKRMEQINKAAFQKAEFEAIRTSKTTELAQIITDCFGEAATQHIIKELQKSKNTNKERALLKALGEMKNKEAIDEVCKHLSSSTPDIREQAIDVIERINTPYAYEALCRNIKNIYVKTDTFNITCNDTDIILATNVLKKSQSNGFEKILAQELEKTEDKKEIKKIIKALGNLKTHDLKLGASQKKKLLYVLLEEMKTNQVFELEEFIKGAAKAYGYKQELLKLSEEQGLIEAEKQGLTILKPKKECAPHLKEYIKDDKKLKINIRELLREEQKLFFTLDELYEKEEAENIKKDVICEQFALMKQSVPVKLREMQGREKLETIKLLESVTNQEVEETIKSQMSTENKFEFLKEIIHYAEKCTVATDEAKNIYNNWLSEEKEKLTKKYKQDLKNLKKNKL